MNPITKKRGDNWMTDDKILLQDLIKDRVSIIENKNTDTNTNKQKKLAWEDLGKSFNAMTKGTCRSVSQLRTQWAIIKMNPKKANATYRRETFKTGVGPRPTTPAERDGIYSWLPNEFLTDVNNFDSDANMSLCSQIPDPKIGGKITDVSDTDFQENSDEMPGGSHEILTEITDELSHSNTYCLKTN